MIFTIPSNSKSNLNFDQIYFSAPRQCSYLLNSQTDKPAAIRKRLSTSIVYRQQEHSSVSVTVK